MTTPPSGGSTDTHSYITSATNADGSIELFAIGTDNFIYADRESAPNVDSWNDWQQLQGGNATSITASSMADGDILVAFVSSTDGHVHYYMQQSPSTDNWSLMETVPNGTVSLITSATNANGSIELLAIGTDGKVYVDQETSPNVDSWDGWYGPLQGGNAISISASTMADGDILASFISSTDKQVHYFMQQTPNQYINWTTIESIHAGLTAISSATNADGSIELFAIGTDNSINSNRESGPNVDAWNGWTQLQGGNASSITASRMGNGRIIVLFLPTSGLHT
jgi:hypothetical protein